MTMKQSFEEYDGCGMIWVEFLMKKWQFYIKISDSLSRIIERMHFSDVQSFFRNNSSWSLGMFMDEQGLQLLNDDFSGQHFLFLWHGNFYGNSFSPLWIPMKAMTWNLAQMSQIDVTKKTEVIGQLYMPENVSVLPLFCTQ